MSKLAVSLDNFRNDMKASDGRLVILTQITLIFFLLTLALTSASVQRYLTENLNNMLGADAVLTSHDPFNEQQAKTIEGFVDRSASTHFMTLTFTHKEKWQQAQLKLVDDNYPLQGAVKTSQTLGGNHEQQFAGPALGNIWLGPRLSTKLGAGVGDILQVGKQRLRVSAIIFHEPDRLMEGHSVAMRAMAHKNSFAGADLKGGKERYRILVDAQPQQLATLNSWVEQNLPAVSLIMRQGGSHPLALFWQRTENFIGLAAVLLFFMAAVAIDMANRRHLSTQKKRLSLFLSFGQKLSSGLGMAVVQWGAGFLVSVLIGTLLAYAAQLILVQQLSEQFPGISGGWHVDAFFKTTLLVALLLLSFQVPAFVQLANTSIIGLIRPIEAPRMAFLRIVWSFASLALLASFYSDNLLLTSMTLGAMGAALILMLALTWLVLNLADVWARGRPGLLPFSFFMMKQRIFSKATQILGLGLCGLLLLFTLMLMRDLGSSLERYTRHNNGNLMITEASARHMTALGDWATQNNGKIRQLAPFTFAKLVRINDTAVDRYVTHPSGTLSTIKSPIRMSWSEGVPDNNQLVSGHWWPRDTRDWQQVSTEPEVMTDLGLKLGDQLTFQIAGATYDFTLKASHAFKPGGGSITFWFQVPETLVTALSPEVRYMGSMELPDDAWHRLGGLWRDHPDLMMAPLKDLTARFDKTLAFVTKLTVGFAAMILLMAGFVIAASIKGFEADDRQKNGLLMSMGLRKSDCLRLNFFDWFVTAIIASVGAIAGTWIAGVLIYQSQFSLTYQPAPLWLLGAVILMVITVCSVGLIYNRQTLNVTVKNLLSD